MNETLEEVVRWGVPAAVVFGVAALLAVTGLWALRRARRGPRARAAAALDRAAAGSALIALDDAVEELDLEVALSGALYDGTAPPALRRARMTAQHARDDGFAQLRDLAGDAHPDEIRRLARGIRTRVDVAAGQIAQARQEHAAWMTAHRTADAQLVQARARLETLRAELGDPEALVADIARQVEDDEAQAARAAADQAKAALGDAEADLSEAAELLSDPTRSALPALARAERALRRARTAARALEEQHRLVTEAARAAPGELAAARDALRQAEALRADLEPEDAERLGGELRRLADDLDAVEARAAGRPTSTIAGVARMRDRLDAAVGDARTAQQRMRGARTALPGTLAAARAAVARAEAAASTSSADARVRLSSAHAELAAARSAQDPVAALDAARRALRHAEDAVALADYDRLNGR
ncbi:hypothetical protein [Microbacterium sp. T2.11-28]|uniref:hypothetical protein n=1 Tax=Microbacterium sp. T2.11-28 TaxID=3041169 RepID=UPI0024772E15|nr:hypothetical protein [Microbacterium sp. T2.11-28]CAI9389614.1 hypothetical protein MICABA_01163 [Microbacterium sp. T2.11-28]